MGVACCAAQFGDVLCLAGTDNRDVIAARFVTIDLPVEPDQKRRCYGIAEQIGGGGHGCAAFESASAAAL
jgi:hypothetical protein